MHICLQFLHQQLCSSRATTARSPCHAQHEEDHLHTAQMNYKSPLLNLVFFFPTVYPGICRLEKEFLSRELSNFCHRRSSRLPLFVLQAVAAHATTIFIMLVDWRRGLVYWIIPNLLAVDGIITMNMLQHDGLSCA
mmetsp:Transcript_2841/g.3995  ORF Transcript_2841/g.3995 Transcript_2841/m.3995 type:complete len:136 (+) Transcript_2841:422-829(+)